MSNIHESEDDILVSNERLSDWACSLLLKAGFDANSSKATSEGLVLASLRGVDSHGIQLRPHYVLAGNAGRLNFNPQFQFKQTGASVGVLDADHALGFPAGQYAIEKCVELAKDTGIGAVSVKNSSHGGMLAYYTLPVARKGMFALTMTNTTPRLIPTGAKRAFFGTNPLCYAAPLLDEEPLCYDSATTQITGNKVKLYRRLEQDLPEGTAADIDGNPTIDPMVAELLYPFGGYKGLGISMLVDLFCGVLAGMPNGDNVSQMYGDDISGHRWLGQFFMVIDIERFRHLQDFLEEIQLEVDRLRKLPAQENQKVLAPGDPEKLVYAERNENGIPMPRKLYDALNETAVSINHERL